MNDKRKLKKWWVRPYLWQITVIMLACSAIYYLPSIAGLAGWAFQDDLERLHDFYGIDFYSLAFFAPVVYAAYSIGVIGALLTALISMLILLPYSILIDAYPNALFKPTAFVIILSAVGAVVAMLQKSDEQRRRSIKELKCLYDIGKSAEESQSVEQFLTSAAELIPLAMPCPKETWMRITLRDKEFRSAGFEESPNKVKEDLVIGGDVAGYIEIHSATNGSQLKRLAHLIQTFAERIGGAVHEIELAQSLRGYYEQLEDMVENRTRDLEQVQDKLIRSERLAAVGELASGVGHELRNPLNVIRNCVYLLHMTLDDKADEDVRNTLQVMDKQIDISNKIVTDLLDFTRIKPLTLSKVNLNSLVKESLSWVTVPDNARVVTDFDGSCPQIEIDSEQVGRAFANIISNALQAMNSHGELKISTGIDDGSAWIKFEDNGCGIPIENLSKLFEPLFTTKPKGIGLGLAITKRIIDQHKGAIEVASQVGKGTSFTVRIPVEQRRKD